MKARLKVRLSFLVFIAFLLCSEIFGQVRVRGYTRKDGTYVQPHYRSSPDGNSYNNWSTKGNVNPYTGKEGTKIAPPSSKGGMIGVQSDGPLEATPAGERESEQRRHLRQLGFTSEDLDGKSYGDLHLMELKFRRAARLKEKGVDVNWRATTFSELSELERKLEKGEKPGPQTATAAPDQIDGTFARPFPAERGAKEITVQPATRVQLVEFLKAKNAILSWDWYSDMQLREIAALFQTSGITAASANPAVPKGFFTVGSTKNEVLAVQGTPTSFSDSLASHSRVKSVQNPSVSSKTGGFIQGAC